MSWLTNFDCLPHVLCLWLPAYLDKSRKYPIVVARQLNNRTPPDGASNTTRGLTDHAGMSSMAGWHDPTDISTRRQLLILAIGDFCFLSGSAGDG